MKNHFSTQDFDGVNSIKVKLPDGGSFTGTLNIDMGSYNTHNGKEFELICTGENRYAINGGVDIKGGYISFGGIKFNSTADGENDVAVKATAPNNSHSVGYVYNCEFNDYDYAVQSVDMGTIIGVDNSVFRNCKYGYYIDCHNLDTSMSRGNSQHNKFINCDNAIVMLSAPSNAPMFSWRFIDNEFFNDNPDSYDFVVGESNGVLYCQENYYGINENNVLDSANLRSVRVNYTDTKGTEVVTNPCVRYYNSAYRLGIDPTDGLYTRIFSGRASQINSADINNLREIGITGSDGQQLIGKLIFGE